MAFIKGGVVEAMKMLAGETGRGFNSVTQFHPAGSADIVEKSVGGGGVKWDDDKLRYDLESPYAREGLVRVLTYGAKKYADRNWEKGISWMRIYAAIMRHLAKWAIGEDIDTESGLSHLDHAACCIHFLQHYRNFAQGKKFDDRPDYQVQRMFAIPTLTPPGAVVEMEKGQDL